ncbi:pyridoxal phosphate-dependent transferase [Apodospora peruviana]|uniref:Pyridoxal phosphate-dependent transferase n=1 Tax=Apodospora peruviana TaxID=516989 RepID=A0AAE0IRA8_9PEZI|nr:pyridoxal phosphate-dependent transferase [Apodospora peruviana]
MMNRLATSRRLLSPGRRHAFLCLGVSDVRPTTSAAALLSVVSSRSSGRSWGGTKRSLASMSIAFQDIQSLSQQSQAPTSHYDRPVEAIREDEYPHMNNGIYLDHSGTTIYARSTVERFAHKMRTGLYGNPHSANEPAKLSGDVVDDVRVKALRFLGADPQHFDLVFVANATAAIKLVADSFRDLAEQTRAGSFWYGYHRDAHTSIVGVRELTHGEHRCFESDGEVDEWLDNASQKNLRNKRHSSSSPFSSSSSTLRLFGYPGQSNLTGRRLPLSWTRKLRETKGMQNTYSLLDGAALAMTSPMHHVFGDPDSAPDFCCVSFYKIFGFPDLGGLIVRKYSGHILALRKYFGGGTVSLVSTIGQAWHMSKGLETTAAAAIEDGAAPGGEQHAAGGLHEGLEDGTLPFHSILALGEAIDVHKELYGSMENVSRHTTQLGKRLYRGISGLRYANGQPVCKVYCEAGMDGDEIYDDAKRQGATVAFNVFRPDGSYESYAAVEAMANEGGLYIRSGGVCCPGGVFAALQYEPWQLNRARSAGHHCGSDGLGVIHELPTGVVRASLGAMSTTRDVDSFISFLRDTFIEKETPVLTPVSEVDDDDHGVGHQYREQAAAYSSG